MRSYIAALAIAAVALGPRNQSKTLVPDLGNMEDKKEWQVINRNVTQENAGERMVVRFDVRQGGGLAFLPNLMFDNGSIEFDVKGKNVVQKSFVGVAFHGIDENSFDLVYFRPFNFKAADSIRRSHSVQYISSPVFGWKTLREQRPGIYEQPVKPVPDPDSWFHVKVYIEYPNVSVFVNGSVQPCLKVEQLTKLRAGWVGLFVGDSSDGSFANLRITRN
jgi:hypothetical protein